jgi:hypothetical protein
MGCFPNTRGSFLGGGGKGQSRGVFLVGQSQTILVRWRGGGGAFLGGGKGGHSRAVHFWWGRGWAAEGVTL